MSFMRMRPLVVESGVAECRSRLSATYIGQSSAKIAQWKNLIAPETGWRSPHTLAKASQKSHMHGHVQRHLLALLAPRHAPLWQGARHGRARSEEHTSELQSLMRLSYAVFCLKTK